MMTKREKDALVRRLWRAESALRDAAGAVDNTTLEADLDRAADAAYRAGVKLEGGDED